MKLILIVIALGILTGCNGVIEEVEITVIKVYEESTEWGCIGTKTKTLVKTSDNRVDDLCGYIGAEGDTVKGVWVSEHHNGTLNGFHTKW